MEARTVCLDTSTKEFATRNYFGVAVFLASPCVERRPLCRWLAALKRDSTGRARSARARPPTTLTNIRSFVNAVSLSVALFSRHGTTHSSHVPVISQSYHRRQGNPARMILQIRDNSRGTRISSRFVDVLVSSTARCLAQRLCGYDLVAILPTVLVSSVPPACCRRHHRATLAETLTSRDQTNILVSVFISRFWPRSHTVSFSRPNVSARS